MKYNILTETAFFRAAQNGSLEDMTVCYGEFIERVVDVCGCKNGKTTAVASLLFAGIELKAMGKGESDGGKGCDVHRRDAEGGRADARLGDSGIGQDGAELDW